MFDQFVSAVRTALAAGPMEYADLVGALRQAGEFEASNALNLLKDRGIITMSVAFDGEKISHTVALKDGE